jgi:hypothetical protein
MITIRKSSGETPAKAQGHEFCNCLVCAIASTAGERDQRRTPHIDFAVLGQVVHRPDRKIDGG